MSTIDRPLTPQEQDERYSDLVPQIDEAFKEGYDQTTLEYHVWEHATSVYSKNALFRAEFRRAGFPNVPGHFMTHIDSKGHDYGFKKFFDLKKSGDNPYTYAEELTVVEGGDILLNEFGIDRFTVEEWRSNTWGTLLGRHCSTLGAFTLCAADMANTGGDYETVMKPASEKLRIEKERLEGVKVDPASFAIGSLIVIARYHFENLGMSHRFTESESLNKIHELRRENLGHLLGDVIDELGLVGEQSINELLAKLGKYGSKIWPFSKKAS